MGDDTSGADRALPLARPLQQFGRIVVVGGGCYGGYYVRQLRRAALAGTARWEQLVVVDRDPACLVSRLPIEDRPPGLQLETSSWDEYFARFLGEASDHPASSGNDAIVPSPLMPHLMAEWILERARHRWPMRHVAVTPLRSPPAVPWQMTAPDGTHFVSFAEWICPINCIEPALCPATRGERSWSLPSAIAAYVTEETVAGHPIDGPYVFHCTHRTYGVGMIDVGAVIAADAAIRSIAADRAAAFLVGTASHCHGALQRIEVGPPPDAAFANLSVP